MNMVMVPSAWPGTTQIGVRMRAAAVLDVRDQRLLLVDERVAAFVVVADGDRGLRTDEGARCPSVIFVCGFGSSCSQALFAKRPS